MHEIKRRGTGCRAAPERRRRNIGKGRALRAPFYFAGLKPRASTQEKNDGEMLFGFAQANRR
jgi:hypothetical protein